MSISLGWLITMTYEYPSETSIDAVVLLHPYFPELNLTKLIKTGCCMASGKRVEII